MRYIIKHKPKKEKGDVIPAGVAALFLLAKTPIQPFGKWFSLHSGRAPPPRFDFNPNKKIKFLEVKNEQNLLGLERP